MLEASNELSSIEEQRAFETRMASRQIANRIKSLKLVYRALRLERRDDLAYLIDENIEFYVEELAARGDSQLPSQSPIVLEGVKVIEL